MAFNFVAILVDVDKEVEEPNELRITCLDEELDGDESSDEELDGNENFEETEMIGGNEKVEEIEMIGGNEKVEEPVELGYVWVYDCRPKTSF
jgi:hypothetical protein